MMSSSVFIHRTRSIPCFLWLKVDSSSRNPFWSSYGKGFHLRNFSSQPENSIKRYYTIPNFICLSRIAATPVIHSLHGIFLIPTHRAVDMPFCPQRPGRDGILRSGCGSNQ
eukprot:363862-Hanusia_phi.AAC.2